MTKPTSSTRRLPPQWAVVGMIAVTPVAVLLYGAVHPMPRWILAVIAATVGLALTLRSRFDRHTGVVYAAAIVLMFSSLSLLPVPASVRTMLHGDLALPVLSTLALTGQAVHVDDLALKPTTTLERLRLPPQLLVPLPADAWCCCRCQ